MSVSSSQQPFGHQCAKSQSSMTFCTRVAWCPIIATLFILVILAILVRGERASIVLMMAKRTSSVRAGKGTKIIMTKYLLKVCSPVFIAIVDVVALSKVWGENVNVQIFIIKVNRLYSYPLIINLHYQLWIFRHKCMLALSNQRTQNGSHTLPYCFA